MCSQLLDGFLAARGIRTRVYYDRSARAGEYPVLVLDDVLSELDKVRQRRLIGRAERMQTVITCTSADKRVFGGAPFKKMTVAAGKLKKDPSSD